MARPEIIHQKDELLYPWVLFNRPINPSLKPTVLLVGGSPGNLTDLSDSFQAALATNVQLELLIPKSLSNLVDTLPVKAYIELNKPYQINKAKLDDAIAASNLIVLAPNLAVNSTNQLAMIHIMQHSQQAMILTDEVLRVFKVPTIHFNNQNMLFLISVDGLIKLANYLHVGVSIKPNRGVYNKIDIIHSLQSKINCSFIVYDAEQLLVCDREGGVGLIEFTQSDIFAYRGFLIGIISGLMADYGSRINEVIPKVLTAGYVLRKCIVNTSKAKGDLTTIIAQSIKNI